MNNCQRPVLNLTRTGTEPVAIWGVIPAAGAGTRMMSAVPKQYLALQGETMLLRSCRTLVTNPAIDGCVVVLAKNDTGFEELPADIRSNVVTTVGGATRSESVAAGVQEVIKRAGDSAWALVHDAARPLLSTRDLVNLVSRVTQSETGGGLLATPVCDTLKRCDQTTTQPQDNTKDDACHIEGLDQAVDVTVDRANLWQAQTPQMFRASALLNALQSAAAAGVAITDEASAMEHVGLNPLLVQAMDPNFKITRNADLKLATAWLLSQSTVKP